MENEYEGKNKHGVSYWEVLYDLWYDFEKKICKGVMGDVLNNYSFRKFVDEYKEKDKHGDLEVV